MNRIMRDEKLFDVFLIEIEGVGLKLQRAERMMLNTPEARRARKSSLKKLEMANDKLRKVDILLYDCLRTLMPYRLESVVEEKKKKKSKSPHRGDDQSASAEEHEYGIGPLRLELSNRSDDADLGSLVKKVVALSAGAMLEIKEDIEMCSEASRSRRLARAFKTISRTVWVLHACRCFIGREQKVQEWVLLVKSGRSNPV